MGRAGQGRLRPEGGSEDESQGAGHHGKVAPNGQGRGAGLADNADFAAEQGEAQGIEQRGGTVFERFGAQDGLEVSIDAVQHFAAGHDADGELGGVRE